MVIKNRTLGYSAIQGFYWMGYASIMGFASVFLLNVGFDNSQVGLLIAAAGLQAGFQCVRISKHAGSVLFQLRPPAS